MKICRIVINLWLVILLTTTIVAQTEESSYKISEFSSFKSKVWKKELDKAKQRQIETNCKDLIYIVVYAASEKKISHIARKYLDYIVERNHCNNFENHIVIVINGGIRKEHLTSVWILPPNTEPPKIK